jgi:hypothetical protein
MIALPDELPGRTRTPRTIPYTRVRAAVVAAAAVGGCLDLLGLDGCSPFAQLAAFRPTLLTGLLVHRGRRNRRGQGFPQAGLDHSRGLLAVARVASSWCAAGGRWPS